MTIEELIESIPYNIYREKDLECISCGTVHKKSCRYELQLKIIPHFDSNKPAYRYLAYYECKRFGAGDSDRYIGRAVGFGQRTIEMAIQELKGIIKGEINERN